MMISNILNSLTCCDYISVQGATLTRSSGSTHISRADAVASRNMLDSRNKEFGITEVKTWVEQHGSIQGRFQFFETYAANSEFYQKVAKPLLSLRTVGLIDFEQRVKGIKGTSDHSYQKAQ